MGTILVETGSIWRRIFLLDPVTASEEQKAGLVRVLQSRYHKVCAGELYRIDGQPLRAPTEAITLDTRDGSDWYVRVPTQFKRGREGAARYLHDVFCGFGDLARDLQKNRSIRVGFATAAQDAEPMDAMPAECSSDASLKFRGGSPVSRRTPTA